MKPTTKGTTLVEILIAMTLLTGLVLPLALAGIRYASSHLARARLESQLEMNRHLQSLQMAQRDIASGLNPPATIRTDTLQTDETLFVLIRTQDSRLLVLAPLVR